jgi:hypothetical protein
MSKLRCVLEPCPAQAVALASRTALAAVAFPKTGANAHRLIVETRFRIKSTSLAAVRNECQCR